MSASTIAVIGSGSISRFHAQALEGVGLEIGGVASMNPNSETVEEFASDFGVEQAHAGDNWRELIIESQWDGIVIATHIDGAPNAVRQSLDADVPILVEKPVAWTSEEVRSLRRSSHDRVMVGYNRRYYEPIRAAKRFLDTHRPVMSTIELPAASDLRSYLDMSCHGVDLLRYLFGELTVLDTHELIRDEELAGFTATLRSDSADLINVIGNWEAPSNIGIALDYQDTRFQVEPYEQARKYHGFRIEGPDEGIPVRQYIPQEVETVDLDGVDEEYKPGFYQQAEIFRKLTTGELRTVPDSTATLEDAERTLELCESLLPRRLPDEFL